MWSNAKIKLIVRTKEMSLYSFVIDNNIKTEFERFKEYGNSLSNPTLKNEFYKIMQLLREMLSKTGALERLFRNEGKMKDHTCAVLTYYTGKKRDAIRLYCLRFSDNILLVGNGGIKPKGITTYQEDERLNTCVEDLQLLDKKIFEAGFAGVGGIQIINEIPIGIEGAEFSIDK